MKSVIGAFEKSSLGMVSDAVLSLATSGMPPVIFTLGLSTNGDFMLPVFGFEDTYTVSMYGEIVALSKKVYQENHPFQKIRNTKQKVLKQHDAGKGYLFVVLFDGKGKKKRMYVHRIVLQAFKPTSHELLQVNHIDGNKKNNHIENLEWCTCSENHVHAYATGLRS